MKRIIFIGLFVIAPFSYSTVQVYSTSIWGDSNCSNCVEIDLNAMNLDFDPGLFTDQSLYAVLGKDGKTGYFIRGRLTDKGLIVAKYGGLSGYREKDPALKLLVGINVGENWIISDRVSVKHIETLNTGEEIVFLEPIYQLDLLEYVVSVAQEEYDEAQKAKQEAESWEQVYDANIRYQSKRKFLENAKIVQEIVL